jgi:bifunctional non-homologous end joining protein LigD
MLASRALPKGVPLVPGECRLAVHVEDHPLDYAGFEGQMPEGEYGAGRRPRGRAVPGL